MSTPWNWRLHRPIQLGLAACAALFSLALAPAPSEDGYSLLVTVWDDQGNVLPDADVVATGIDGDVKALTQPGGNKLLMDIGTQVGSLLKTTIQVNHPAWGGHTADVYFELTPVMRLEVVFTGVDSAESFSPQQAAPPTSNPGDGPPSNDDCGGAISVAVGSLTVGSTVGANVDGLPTCGTSITAPGVWYRVTGTGSTMTATTCTTAPSYDTKLSVFCGDCGTLTCVGGNDDDCGLLSTVSWCSQAGADYLVLVHGFSSNTGPFELGVSSGSAPCSGAITCLQPGACCLPDGSCAQINGFDCEQAGGTFNGAGSECFSSGTSQTYSAAPGAAIPDNNPVGLSSSIVVGDAFTIGDVNVGLSINHTWVGDLIVTLTHVDSGTSVVLVDRQGVPAISTFGCDADNWAGAVLDDEGAGGAMENQCLANLTSPPNYTPEGLLSAFDGESSAGTWTLNVSDNADADTGSLVSWSMFMASQGEPNCEPPECFLVIGDGPGASAFVGAAHEFEAQVGPEVEDHFPVVMESIPSFPLPKLAVRNGGTLVQSGLFGQPGGPDAVLPDWMEDGHFAVQVLMWNPNVFPNLPEQYTVGLDVVVKANGSVVVTPFGEAMGPLTISHEIVTLPNGERLIRFPFVVPMP